MGFAGSKLVTDLQQAHSTFGLGYVVFALLWRRVGKHLFQFLCGNEKDVLRQGQVNVIKLNGHILLGLAEALIDCAYRIL